MSDILFKCPLCACPLTADITRVEQIVSCMACQQPVRVPKPSLAFQCNRCQARLVAPNTVAGETFTCPACTASLHVPPQMPPALIGRIPTTGSPSAGNTAKSTTLFLAKKASASTAKRQCPKCRAEIEQTAVVCIKCGSNLVTGARGKRAIFSRAFVGNLFSWAVLALILAGGYKGWQNWKTQERLAGQQQQKIDEIKKTQQIKEAEALKRAAMEAAQAEAERQRLARENEERAQREQCISRLRDRYFNTAEVNLFDALSLLSTRHDLRTSIDPDAIGILQRVSVKLADLETIRTTANIAQLLQKHNIATYSCPVSDKDTNQVCFVTTESIWAYSCASRFLNRGQPAQARQRLESLPNDSNGFFGGHGAALRKLLDDTTERQAELRRLSQAIITTMADCERSYQNSVALGKEAQEIRKIQSRGGKTIGKGPDELMQAAINEYNKAFAGARDVCHNLQNAAEKVNADNQSMSRRYADTCNARLFTEARYLMNTDLITFTMLKAAISQTENSSIFATANAVGSGSMSAGFSQCQQEVHSLKETLGDIPSEIREKLDALDALVRSSSDRTTALGIHDAIPGGLKASDVAFFYDKGNVLARISAGYFRMQLYAKALHEIHSAADMPILPADAGTLVEEFAGLKKQALLQAVADFTNQKGLLLPAGETLGKPGAATDLCVYDNGDDREGGPFPLQIWTDPVNHASVHPLGGTPPPSAYWKPWFPENTAELTAKPIVFEDYGAADGSMCGGALEVYTWLCIAFPANMQNRTTHIAFPNQRIAHCGDSVGATMATAAYSWLNNKPIRNNVAMTGTFRRDGAVFGVDGIFEKIRGAATTPGIEMVIIPSESETAAMAVPMDTLCRVAIVSANDIHVYLKYATEPAFNQKPLAKLRLAQVNLLMGKKDQAVSLLLEVVADCPEIFTARRLLELIALANK